MTFHPARDTFADAQTFPSLFDNTGAAETTEPAETAETPTVSFRDLGLPGRLTDALAREGITSPFPIQAATIPDALNGRDVLGRGQTGSGKTLAFGLPLLARLASSGKAAPGHPKALILVPTRELAMQVNDALMPLARAMNLFSRTALGGTSYDKQIRDLRRGVDIMVATPGRLGDLIERGECSLELIEITVLDEADQMADMGFLPDVTALLEKTPEHSQRLLFSATLDNDVDALVKRFLHDPVTHEVDSASASVSTMDHHLLLIPPAQKFDIVASIGARAGRTIMFVRTQMAVDRLAEQLAAVGVRSGALHGGKTQRARTRTLAEFREGRFNVLVATDVAARGIHVDDVSLVVHIDPPKDSKDYLHRAGRTARAGESGMVVTLVMPRQRRSTYSMLERAGVEPGRTEVRLGAPELATLTGAREPSGVAVPPDELSAPKPGAGRFGERRSFGDRPSYRDRGPSSDRRASGGGYGERRGYGDRPARPSYGDRPAHGGGDRPAYGGGRPSYGAGDRPTHGGGDRQAHSGGDRPTYGGGDRPTHGGDRQAHGGGDRPTYGGGDRATHGGGDRATHGGGRPSYGDGSARPSYGDRPVHGAARPSYGDRPSGDRSAPGGDRTGFRPDRTDRFRSRDDRPREDRPHGNRPRFERRTPA